MTGFQHTHSGLGGVSLQAPGRLRSHLGPLRRTDRRDPRSILARYAWAVYLGAATACIAVYASLSSLVAQDVTYAVFSLVACLTVVAGIALHRPPARLPWTMLAGGLAVNAAGEIAWSVSELAGHAPPAVSWIDGLYVSAYPLMAVGVLLIARGRERGCACRYIVDTAIMTVGMALWMWVLLIAPRLGGQADAWSTSALTVVYPIADLVLAMLIMRLLVGGGARGSIPTMTLLCAGLVAWVAADVAYAFLQSVAGGYHTGDIPDVAWMAAYMLLGGAALHPTMVRATMTGTFDGGSLTIPRTALLALALLTPPALVVFQWRWQPHVDVPIIAGGGAMLALLVVVRMAGLVVALQARRCELSRTLEALRAVQAERDSLLRQTVVAAENERIHVSSELHDGPIQSLSAIGYDIERIGLYVDRGALDRSRELIAVTRGRLVDEVVSLRQLMADLRPAALAERGLEPAVVDYIIGLSERTGIVCAYDVRIGARLGTLVETTLYRIVQEALTNVAKHACAGCVIVALEQRDGAVVLRVSDDGRGFDPARPCNGVAGNHFGLAIMRERAESVGGDLAVESRRGFGATITGRFPLGRREA